MENKEQIAIIANKTVLDRIEQSFELFKNNFKELFLPIFLYTLGTITVLMGVLNYFWIKYLQIFFTNFNKTTRNLEWLHYGAEIITGIIIFIILIILYLTLYIPFLLATIKGIKQAYNGEKVTPKENIIYGFKNIFNSFKTYWYVFAYVALIPALIGIIGGFLSIYGMQPGNKIYTQIGVSISIFALIFFVFFSIYRGTKSNFYMISAIDKNEFTLENFNFSIKVTKNQFWRIIGNFLLIGLIINLITGIINQIIGLFGTSFDFSIKTLINLKENYNNKEIMNLVNETMNSYSSITNFILNSLENIVSTASIVFILIFTYILFKRLEIENTPEIIKEEKTEL